MGSNVVLVSLPERKVMDKIATPKLRTVVRDYLITMGNIVEEFTYVVVFFFTIPVELFCYGV